MTFRDIAGSLLAAYDWRVLWIRGIIVFFDQKRVSDRVKGTPIASIVLRSYVLRCSSMDSPVLHSLEYPRMSPLQYVVLADSLPLSLLRLGPG